MCSNDSKHPCPLNQQRFPQRPIILRSTQNSPMRIGELAAVTGCTPKALRLYEARGLLGTVARRGSYRHYGLKDVQRVQWIRQALALGFRLAALEPLRTIETPDGAAAVLTLLQTRRSAIADELARLQAADTVLAELAVELATCDGTNTCRAPEPLA